MARTARIAALTVPLALLAACGDDGTTTASGPAPVIDPGDGGEYRPDIAADDFDPSQEIDNPYLPFRPGARWVYEGQTEDGVERIEVTVTGERRTVMGIEAWVVRDTVTVGGEIAEDTDDWFAQDRDGNVWYLGEESTEYEDGEPVSTDGSWEAGVDGALPGVVMPARPAVGDVFRQEFYAGEAEDMFEIVAIDGVAEVPAGSFTDVVVTQDWNPLEPDVVEEKRYAPGVGLVAERKVEGDDEVVELLDFAPGG
jgi:hypothetical protein